MHWQSLRKTMNFLRNNIILAALFFTFGCATSSYKVLHSEAGKTEVLTSPDRIALECEALENGRFGFMLHVLDNQNTYFTAIQGNQLDAKTCESRITQISKILKRGRRIYLAGMGVLTEPSKPNSHFVSFEGLGRFPGNGRVLQYMYIKNDKGHCFGAYTGEELPCPRDEFPIAQ